MSNLEYELIKINSQIGNVTEYLTSQYLSEAKRHELEYRLDNLCTKHDFIQAKIENLNYNNFDIFKDLAICFIIILMVFSLLISILFLR